MTQATEISQAIVAALETIPGLAVIRGRDADWLRQPVYPVLVLEPRTERLEGISPPKIKYSRTWAIEILVDQNDPEPALTSLLRETFTALNLASAQPKIAGARLSAGDVAFNLFIEQQPQSSAVFQLSATFVE